MNQEKTVEQIYIEQVAGMREKKSTRQLSPNTTKDYISAYRKLKSILGPDITSYFHDYEDNTAKLLAAGLKPSRIRNLYNAYINLMYAHDIHTDTTSKYQKYLKDHQEAYMNSQKSNELTSESQIENMITYSELLDYINKLKQNISSASSPIEEHLVQEKKEVLLILEICKILPYRINEFSNMRYIDWKNFEKIVAKGLENEDNWLVKKGWDYFFHFKQYETTKQRPSKIQKIDKPLAKIIRAYLKEPHYGSIIGGMKTPVGDKLFNNYSPEQLSKLMIKVSKEIIGKNVGSAILRKVVISHKYQATKDQTQEQEAFAKAIGHSLAIENLIYNKNIGE